MVFPLFTLLDRWAVRSRRIARARIGRPGMVEWQFSKQRETQRVVRFSYSLAWVMLILGVAGPCWGKSPETGVAVGRDVVIVIDLSRSMLADDMTDRKAPTRWEAARNAAIDIIASMARRGGHRVGVVVFAARTKLLCPLTTDYDHARAVVEGIEGDYPPPEIRPTANSEVISGTRIGAALVAAVKAHDNRFPGYQDIVLLSDGDDPGDDLEWVRGSDAAREARIPVHTVGIGDPLAGTFLIFNEEPFETRLQEEPLKQIASETRGQYLAARKETYPLGEFFRTRIEPLPSREVGDETVPLLKERYAWFLTLSLLFFAIGWKHGL
jgi:Ca-activated chloride channel family protein